MTSLRKDPKDDIILKEWKPTFVWNFNCEITICGLTKRQLTDLDPNDEVSRGACGHAFHHSALMKWFDTQKKDNTTLICPTCKMSWRFDSQLG